MKRTIVSVRRHRSRQHPAEIVDDAMTISCVGVSIVPNSLTAAALSHVIV
jgi:hypothetical protein